jgi:hypothetical protein
VGGDLGSSRQLRLALRVFHTILTYPHYRRKPVLRQPRIPTVKSLPQAKAGDRIVQTALKMVVEPIPRVGLRPARGHALRRSSGRAATASGQGAAAEPALAKAGDALREVDRLLKEGLTWVVDAATSTASRTTG